jgi:hypothetical protein
MRTEALKPNEVEFGHSIVDDTDGEADLRALIEFNMKLSVEQIERQYPGRWVEGPVVREPTTAPDGAPLMGWYGRREEDG